MPKLVTVNYVKDYDEVYVNYGTIKLYKWPFLWPSQAHHGDKFDWYAWRGRFHFGIDIGNWDNYRDNLVSPCSGKVIQCELTHSGYGRLVRIEAGGLNNGYKLEVRLGHLYRHFLKVGQLIKKGSVIAEVGGRPGDSGSGNTTAPHVHLELWARMTIKGVDVFYQPIDPSPLFA